MQPKHATVFSTVFTADIAEQKKMHKNLLTHSPFKETLVIHQLIIKDLFFIIFHLFLF